MLGDHIRTLKAGRWTHAIDCGDETVIVLAEDAVQAPRVRRSYRPEFVGGSDAVEVVRHRERTFPADEVVARAYSRISDPALASMFRDSEAFAEWCTTGRLPSAPPAVASSGKAAGATAPPVRAVRAKKAATKARAAAKPARSAKPARKPKPARRAKAPPRRKPAARGRAARKGAKRRTRGRR